MSVGINTEQNIRKPNYVKNKYIYIYIYTHTNNTYSVTGNKNKTDQ